MKQAVPATAMAAGKWIVFPDLPRKQEGSWAWKLSVLMKTWKE